MSTGFPHRQYQDQKYLRYQGMQQQTYPSTGRIQNSQQGWDHNERNQVSQKEWDKQRSLTQAPTQNFPSRNLLGMQNQRHNNIGWNSRKADVRKRRPSHIHQKKTNIARSNMASTFHHVNTNGPASKRKRPLNTTLVRNKLPMRKKGRMFAAERRAAKKAARKLQPGFTKEQLQEKLKKFVSVGLENAEEETDEKSEKKLVSRKGLLKEQNTWGLQKMYGKGFKLLSKSGWKPGKSLGLQGQGILTPLITITKSDKRGIAHGKKEKRSVASRLGESKKKSAERRRLERRRMERMHGLPRGALSKAETAPGCGTAKTRAKKRLKWRKGVENRLGLQRGALSRFGHSLVESATRAVITNIELEFGIQSGRLVNEVMGYRQHIRNLRNGRGSGGTINKQPVSRFSNYSSARMDRRYLPTANRYGWSSLSNRGGYSNPIKRGSFTNHRMRGRYSEPNIRDDYSNPRLRPGYSKLSRGSNSLNSSINRDSNHSMRDCYSSGNVRKGYLNANLRAGYSNGSVRGGRSRPSMHDHGNNTCSLNINSHYNYNEMSYFNKSYNMR